MGFALPLRDDARHGDGGNPLADHLGIDKWRLMTGPVHGRHARHRVGGHGAGSRGRHRPGGQSPAPRRRTKSLGQRSQLAAITADPKFRGGDYYDAADGDGPHVGIGIARMIAHTTYRSESELAERFGRGYQGGGDPLGKGGQFAVQSYLQHHARKLARRFDANTYVRLAQAIQSPRRWPRPRRRGDRAWRATRAPRSSLRWTATASTHSRTSQRLDAALSGSDGVKVVHSPVGHDGFLVESGQLNAFMSEFEQNL